MVRRKYDTINVFLIYNIIIGAYFLQFPLSGSLPGKIDSWFYLATNEYLYQFFLNHFSLDGLGTILYPSENYLSLGNLSVGYSFLYIPLRLLNWDSVWIYWVITSLTYSSNAIGFYLVGRETPIGNRWSFIAAFFFSMSNYSLANTDNLDGLCWAPGIISISYFIRYFKEKNLKHLMYSTLAVSLQIYFSSYMFLLTGFILMFGAFYLLYKNTDYYKTILSDTFKCTALGIVLIAPIIYILFIHQNLSENFNLLLLDGANTTGIVIKDLITYLPYNPLSDYLIVAKDFWNEKAHCAGIGILTPLIGLYGIYRLRLNIFFWILTFTIFLLCIKNQTDCFGITLYNPIYLILDVLGLSDMIRIKIRFYIFIIFIIFIGWGYILSKIEKELGFKKVVILLILIATVENIPYKLRTYNSQETIDQIRVIAQTLDVENKVTLHLPSSIYTSLYPPFYEKLIVIPDSDNEMMHEQQYMYLQSLTKENTINGNCAFIPIDRIQNQILIHQIHDSLKLNQLVNYNGIDYIFVHIKNIDNTNSHTGIEYYKNALKNYKIVKENSEVIIYSTAYNSTKD